LTPFTLCVRLSTDEEESSAPAQEGSARVAQPGLTAGLFLQGRYRVEYLIATGGYACVYRVTDMQVEQPRALKEVVDPDLGIREQFLLEAQLLMRSRHPNIPRGYDHFETNHRAYLVMDYVEGHDLEQMLATSLAQRKRPVDEGQVLRWLLPICDALHEMHTQPVPIIHRDIKPANIKLNGQGVPILIDFGLAKLSLPGPTNQAAQGVTPGYAPPEQYLAQGKTDPRTDIYGMGATMYTLLTGREPPEAPNRLLTKSGHTGEPMVPARLLNPLISAPTANIIDKAMSIGTSQRHQSARELQNDLAAALRRLEYGRPPVAGGVQTGPLASSSYGATQRRPAVQLSTADPAPPAIAEQPTMPPSAFMDQPTMPPLAYQVQVPPVPPHTSLPPRGAAAPTRAMSPAPPTVPVAKALDAPRVWFNLGGPLVQKTGKVGLVLAAVELYWGLLCAAALGGALGTSGFSHAPSLAVILAGVGWLIVVIWLTALIVRAIDRPIARRGRLSTPRRWLQGLSLGFVWLAMNAAAFLALNNVAPTTGLLGLGFLGLASILTGLLSVANVLG
jgi:serine/threonine protein kinase